MLNDRGGGLVFEKREGGIAASFELQSWGGHKTEGRGNRLKKRFATESPKGPGGGVYFEKNRFPSEGKAEHGEEKAWRRGANQGVHRKRWIQGTSADGKRAFESLGNCSQESHDAENRGNAKRSQRPTIRSPHIPITGRDRECHGERDVKEEK